MAYEKIELLTEDADVSLQAEAVGEDLWVAPAEMERATGWKLTADGFCREALCIPIPSGREAAFSRADGSANLAGLSRLRGQATVHDDRGSVWAFGPVARGTSLSSVEAPDFTLPDLSGRMFSLHAFRGKKVLLASWA